MPFYLPANLEARVHRSAQGVGEGVAEAPGIGEAALVELGAGDSPFRIAICVSAMARRSSEMPGVSRIQPQFRLASSIRGGLVAS